MTSGELQERRAQITPEAIGRIFLDGDGWPWRLSHFHHDGRAVFDKLQNPRIASSKQDSFLSWCLIEHPDSEALADFHPAIKMLEPVDEPPFKLGEA